MRQCVRLLLPALGFLGVLASGFAQTGTCSGMSLGQGANLNGFVPFPSSNSWNTDISNAPVDPNSNNYINYIGLRSHCIPTSAPAPTTTRPSAFLIRS